MLVKDLKPGNVYISVYKYDNIFWEHVAVLATEANRIGLIKTKEIFLILGTPFRHITPEDSECFWIKICYKNRIGYILCYPREIENLVEIC